MALIPSASEAQLSNIPTAGRLAVICDLLQQAFPGFINGQADQITNSADMSGADANLTPVPTVGSRLVVDEVLISVGATAMNVTLKEETSGTVMVGPIYCAVNSTTRFKVGKQLPTVNKRLLGRTSAAGNVTIQVFYHSNP